MNPSLWSQINGIILGKVRVYQLGNWGNPYIKKIIFSKLIFDPTFANCGNHIYLFIFGIIYKMYVIIDDFVYFDHFCYAN